MTAPLAGSRFLDERRRRRLAADSGEDPLFTLAARPQQAGQAAASSPSPSALHFPLQKAISRRLWKIWAVGTLGLVVGAALLSAGFYAERAADVVGPAFVHLFDLAAGRAIRFFSIVYFVLCGQLAMFVWWGRARRQRGLNSRLRVWSSLAATCFLMSFFVATDTHLALNDTVLWLLKRDLGPRRDLCWLSPLAGSLLIFLWMLHRDMRECRTGLVMLWLAALSWTAAGSMVVVEAIPAEPLMITLTKNAAAMFGHWCFLMSLLLHARHVVYKSAEPSQVAAPKTGWRFPRIRLWGNSSNTDGAAADGAAKRRATKEKAAAAAADKKAKPRPTSKPEPTVKNTTPVAAKPTAPVAAKVAAAVASKPSVTVAQPPKAAPVAAAPKIEQPRPKPSTQIMRIDDPDDDDESDSDSENDGIDKGSLKGLSKRERRKLRKQWRDEQRGEGGDSDSED